MIFTSKQNWEGALTYEYESQEYPTTCKIGYKSGVQAAESQQDTADGKNLILLQFRWRIPFIKSKEPDELSVHVRIFSLQYIANLQCKLKLGQKMYYVGARIKTTTHRSEFQKFTSISALIHTLSQCRSTHITLDGFLKLIKMGFLKNDLENFNCLFLKKV